MFKNIHETNLFQPITLRSLGALSLTGIVLRQQLLLLWLRTVCSSSSPFSSDMFDFKWSNFCCLFHYSK